ncbi:MAG: hypothetical protein DMG67_03530 [Acidobacteria bacterium]|nr:MAG: hypothetical protein DMG67_03530 [Acidobacteriota bacterium]
MTLPAHEQGKFLSSNGNVAPEMFKCILPLRVGAKLAGMVGLGARLENSGTSDKPVCGYGPV